MREKGRKKRKPDRKQCPWGVLAPRVRVQQTQNERFPGNNILIDCIRFKGAFVACTWFPYENMLRSEQPVYNRVLQTQST